MFVYAAHRFGVRLGSHVGGRLGSRLDGCSGGCRNLPIHKVVHRTEGVQCRQTITIAPLAVEGRAPACVHAAVFI